MQKNDGGNVFSWVPDIDGDGQHTELDLLILNELQREEDMRRKRFSPGSSDYDDEDGDGLDFDEDGRGGDAEDL